jgi:uncharacterized surface protein with fasciclin (FAS1) repeats
MVSYSGYWQYQNIIQAEPIQKKEKCYVPDNSITGYLHGHPDFRIFSWMIKLADMELKMGNEQFDSTLFAVRDADLLRQFGGEGFFTGMDKQKAIHILNAHLLNRKIHKKTLESQRLTKIFTKNQSTELYFLNNYGEITINNMAKMIQEDIKVGNGVIHIIDKIISPIF